MVHGGLGVVQPVRKGFTCHHRPSTKKFLKGVVQPVPKGFMCHHRPSTRKILHYPESWDRSSLGGGECEEDKLTNILRTNGMRFALRGNTMLGETEWDTVCVLCVLCVLNDECH